MRTPDQTPSRAPMEWPACRAEMGPTAWDQWLGVEITRPSPISAFLRVRHPESWPAVVDAMFRYRIDAAWAET